MTPTTLGVPTVPSRLEGPAGNHGLAAAAPGAPAAGPLMDT
jgi:hypothetical protein